MSGHSKWANIQHRKKAQDAKRGKLFTKLIREINVAARVGGSDINANPRLRLTVDKALAGNMTKDTIQRAIKRGAGEMEGQSFFSVRYEGYGVNGVAVLVECMTDNRNRTVAEVRSAFNKHGGNLSEAGSVSYLFTQGGMLFYEDADGDTLLEAALDAGANDIVDEGNNWQVITEPDALLDVKAYLDSAGFTPQDYGIEMRPSTYVEVDEEAAEKLLGLLESLEDLDDVQNVYCNAHFPR